MSTELRTIEFHGDKIVTFEKEGIRYVAMRRIVENIGLAWEGQRPKLLDQKDKFNCHDIMAVAADGKEREMLSMPVEKFPLWLACINPNKIKNDATRGKVELYQAESAIALHDYWTKGAAIKGDVDGLVTGLDPSVMRAIGGMMKGIVHKELSAVVPDMVEAALLADGRSTAVSRLRRFSAQIGKAPRISRETGRYLFDVDVIARWLREEGDGLIAQHVACVAGQGVLPFSRPKK